MDLLQKRSATTSQVASVQAKTCADCRTTRTPLWRSGPAGPRSLCNACGIRNRKRRRALLGLGMAGSEKMVKKKNESNNNGGVAEKVELQRSWGRKMKMKMREEEVAAMLLMALSCG